jgi:TM2 domain-containing membrane protein YozV
LEHDSDGPEPPGIDPPTGPAKPEPEDELDVAERLRALEEEARRLREQLRERQAGAEPPREETEAPSEEAQPAAKDEPPAPLKAAVEKAAESPPPTSPEAQAEADALVTKARVAKIRGHGRECMDLLKQAEQVAPYLPSVVEALGDEMATRSLWKEAQTLYGRATRLAPGNVAIERKYASAVLRASVPIEALLMGGGTHSLAEDAANANIAAVWSFFFPGVGQMVLGETVKGVVFLVGWLASWTVTLLIPNGLKGLIALSGTAHNEPNWLVILPLLLAVGFWLGAFYDAKSRARNVHKPKVDRPVPPVNLPFE